MDHSTILAKLLPNSKRSTGHCRRRCRCRRRCPCRVRPTYGVREQELFRFRIVLPDRKNSAKDMAFCPTESFHTAAQGREHAALLALLKLQEDQPLERKLPEPYK